MRILWHSNAPWANSGYGSQTRVNVPRIQGLGHDIGISAWFGLEGGVILWKEGIPVYPRTIHPYGTDSVGAHAADFKADVIISLADAWPFDHEIMNEKAHWCPWFPVDHEPIPPAVERQVRHSFQPIVFSRLAKRLWDEQHSLPAMYVPHCVDTDFYAPGDQAEAREAINVPEDAFIVGIVAANKGYPARKSWPQMLEAFAEFARRRDDAHLYIHTHITEEMQGHNLVEMVELMGIDGNRVHVCDQYRNFTGRFGDEYMVNVYNAIDVLMNPAMGEGFGVPILEAQACGTPVIVGRWTAMAELDFNGDGLTKDEAIETYTNHAAYQWVPRVSALIERLNNAYEMKGTETLLRAASVCRNAAMNFDADLVAQKHWKPTLDIIEARLKEDEEVEVID